MLCIGSSSSLIQNPTISSSSKEKAEIGKDMHNKKHMIKPFLIIIPLCLMMTYASYCFAADSDIISKIVNEFASKTNRWTTISQKYARLIFYWCAILEIAWLGIKMALGASDLRETIKNFCITIFTCGFFLAVINNYSEWSYKIINGMLSISAEMGEIQNSSDNVFKMGLDLCKQVWEIIPTIVYTEIGTIFGMVIALFITIVCFCLITAQVIFVKCEAYIAMLAACILVGFGASSFMRDYAINVLKYILAVAFKLFVMQLVIGIGYSFMKEAISPKADLATICIIIGVAIVLLALVKQLPDTVAGIIQGSHVSSGQALTSTQGYAQQHRLFIAQATDRGCPPAQVMTICNRRGGNRYGKEQDHQPERPSVCPA